MRVLLGYTRTGDRPYKEEGPQELSAKYTVSFRAPYATDWSKSQHPSLTIALNNAWRRYKKDCSVAHITYAQETIFNREELAEAFTEMDNLTREQAKRQPFELAERVIQAMNK